MARPGSDGVEFVEKPVPYGPHAPPGPAPTDAEDVLETVRSRRLPVALVAAGCLVVGAALGFAAARKTARHPHATAPPPAPAVAAPVPGQAGGAGPAVVQSSGQCALRSGRTVQVGVQVVNSSAEPVTLLRVHVDLPLQGLKAVAQAWGPCGSEPTSPRVDGYEVSPGANAWLTVTFRTLADCPGPLPVVLTDDYRPAGRPVIVGARAFADLTDAPSSACTARS